MLKLNTRLALVSISNIRRCQRRASLSILVLIGACFFASTTYALPMGWTSFTLNGDLGVRDTLGNEWLSPTATEQLSFNAALGTTLVTIDGFRAVTSAEFVGLLSDYLLPASIPDVNMNGFPDVDEFLSPLGGAASGFLADFGFTNQNLQNNFDVTRNFGLLLNADPALAGLGMVGTLLNNGTVFGGVESGARAFDANTAFIDIGTWLFRPAQMSVPEPSTWLLLVVGMLTLVGQRYRGRRRHNDF